ncbi:phosphate-starvation-inducible PsiE family protein [Pseudaestuariivita atlantica]|uniref:Diguanylate cyclase n=1 Tax=Pseudaestuariivita atlantica TaxID=1317121 RepID=A0A0L1JJQ8_9RHOB|nr:phosphate-starvation-inducible PsiE family protein [Pseudaestuariivita atlantica]KNG91942.1 hypothetical protein ATO11_20070 [Pseudaestuariivita atlantica]
MNQPDDERREDRKTRFLEISHSFEFVIVIVLFGAISLVVLLAMGRLGLGIYSFVAAPSRFSEAHAIQQLFGMVLTVLIALELGNSIMRHLRDNETIIQAREIILISLMAIVRKIMLVDLETEAALSLVWLGLATLTLAAAYWLMSQTERPR